MLYQKNLVNGRDPTDGFVLQDSSSTNVLADTDFSKTSITANDYGFDRKYKIYFTSKF